MIKAMKKIFALSLVALLMLSCFAGCVSVDEKPAVTMATKNADGLYTTDPVTLNIIVARHPEATTSADQIWIFKYMEYWFAQQGYNVTINVQDSNDRTQINLMMNSDSLPDIVWGYSLSATDTVHYGAEEGLILDWTPYLNEELMPNLCAQYAANPSMKAAQTAPDGGIYGLPYITPYPYSTIPGMVNRVFVRQSWLDEFGLSVPKTQDEFINMLRAFKNKKLEGGKKVIPLVSDANFLEKYLWTCLGYYGSDGTKYGTGFMIKDEKVQLPCYTEDYREFVTIMHTLYSEGLIASDYFSMSSATATAKINEGVCGAHAWWTLQYVDDEYADQVLLGPIPMGGNDDVYVSRLSDFTPSTVWVSSKTKYPEVVALMLDFLYSEEGSMLYMYGPKEGEDPLGLVDGWYYREDKTITTKLVEEGTYSLMELYARDYIRPHDCAGFRVDPVTNGTGEIITYKDAVTGLDYNVIHDRTMTRSSNDEWWRLETIEKWTSYATSIRLPMAYLDSDTLAVIGDKATAVNQWVTQETAKFISGKRPLSDIDKFFDELKGFGVEEYIATYQAAYAGFMAQTYGTNG